MLTLMLLSVLVFTLLGHSLLFGDWSHGLSLFRSSGIAVEYIRWTQSFWIRLSCVLLIKPNLLCNPDTREPDNSMLEVAIESFKTCVRLSRICGVAILSCSKKL